MIHCGYFDTTPNLRQSLCYSDTKNSWLATPPFLRNLRSKWPTPFEKRRFRPISAHNVLTVKDSEKSSITTNIKSTTGFPTSHRWSAYVTPKCPKRVAQRAIFSFFNKSQRLIVSSAVNLVRRWVSNIWWSAAMLIASTVDTCIQQLGRVEEIVWLP